MKNRLIFAFGFLVLLSSCGKDSAESFDLMISNVAVVDVSSGDIIQDQVVLISGDTIRKVVSAGEVDQYSAKETIDGAGKFIMPGLWDMHVHFRGGDTLVEENKDLLPLFLAYGITSVRDAGGDITPSVLEWREQIKNKKLAGPQIFTPGPKLDGDKPAWAGSIKISDSTEIGAALDSLQSIGADYVKMYDGNLSEELFYGIIKEAEERGLKTTGHMPLTANFLKAIDLGLDGAEHMYYPLTATSPVADSLRQQNIGYGMMEEIIDTYDPQLAQEVFDTMSREDVFITPTLYIGKTLAEILDRDHSRDTLLPYIGSGIQETYKGRIEGAKRAKASGSNMREKMEQISARMISPMQEAGVKILAGSDSGPYNSFVYPGESLHGELNSLVNAGLSPQQALQTSVINGPLFFDLQDSYGSVSEGKVADLLLLDKNPLENIENLKEIFAVVRAGETFDKSRLNKMLGELE